MMRTRVIRVLIVLSILSTFLPWFIEPDESVVGLADTSGQLAALAAAIGLITQSRELRAGWIGPAFAAAVMVRSIIAIGRSDETDLGVGLGVGAVAAAAAAILMIWELLTNIRAAAADNEPNAS